MKKMIILAMAVVMTLAFTSMGFCLKKDVVWKTLGEEGAVTFSHEIHTEKNKLECKECHPGNFKMKKGGTEGVTMEAMKAGKNCGACHNGKKAFSVEDAANCGKCHKK